jgi:hypothetical protein
MFDSLRSIKNPALRSATSASTALAVVTIASTLVIAIASPKDKPAYKLGVYASLLATVAGGVLGLAVKGKSQPTVPSSSNPTKLSDNNTWKDWRNFIVVRKVKESEEITSFYLKPQDNGSIPDYKPGQFLTIKLDIPEQPRPVIRTYSLSDYSQNSDYYRLSIKRESAPKGLDVPPGVASNFMHDRIQEGSIIPAKPPNGKFFIDVNKPLPAVLISNGVGITPMIAMAKACTQGNSRRNLWFLHGARNGDYHAFCQEVNAIADNSNLQVHYKYSRPRPEDEGMYHSQGYVDKQLIETSILPQIKQIYGSTDAEYFLCGSPSFMDAIREGLSELGVPQERVFLESFSKGASTKSETKNTFSNNGKVDSAEIVFVQSGKTLTWNSGDGTILEFAENNGINPPYSCRQGICLTCMCAIQEGEVEYTEPTTNEPDEGSVLICISQPKTDKVVLDL